MSRAAAPQSVHRNCIFICALASLSASVVNKKQDANTLPPMKVTYLGSEDTAWIQCYSFLNFSLIANNGLQDFYLVSYTDAAPQECPVQNDLITCQSPPKAQGSVLQPSASQKHTSSQVQHKQEEHCNEPVALGAKTRGYNGMRCECLLEPSASLEQSAR